MENDNKKANTLCIISLACSIIPRAIAMLERIVNAAVADTDTVLISSSIENAAEEILNFIIYGFGLAAFVIMIYVRVKYPQNKFGKVLMWLYIIAAIIAIITLVIAIVTCYYAFDSCMYNCTHMNCSGIS